MIAAECDQEQARPLGRAIHGYNLREHCNRFVTGSQMGRKCLGYKVTGIFTASGVRAHVRAYARQEYRQKTVTTVTVRERERLGIGYKEGYNSLQLVTILFVSSRVVGGGAT